MRLNVIAVDDNLVHEFGLLSDAESLRSVDGYYGVEQVGSERSNRRAESRIPVTSYDEP